MADFGPNAYTQSFMRRSKCAFSWDLAELST